MRRLFINSVNYERSTDGLEINGQTVNLQTRLDNLRSIQLDKITWPKSWYVIDAWNDTLLLTSDLHLLRVVLTHGDYTAEELADELKAQLNFQEVAHVTGRTWDITFADGYYTFTSAGGDPFAEWFWYDETNDSYNNLMITVGFGPQHVAYTDMSIGIELPYGVDLSTGITSIYLIIDELSTQNFINVNKINVKDNIIAQIPVPTERGLNYTYEPRRPFSLYFDQLVNVNNLTIKLYAWIHDYFYLIPFRGAHFQISLNYTTTDSLIEEINREGKI